MTAADDNVRAAAAESGKVPTVTDPAVRGSSYVIDRNGYAWRRSTAPTPEDPDERAF
jgi:hypothetical protein